MLRRWYRNIKWLFNSPPIGMVDKILPPCEYCGGTANLHYVGSICFCFNCLKKVMDKALKE